METKVTVSGGRKLTHEFTEVCQVSNITREILLGFGVI